jgi:hypothetical protein
MREAMGHHTSSNGGPPPLSSARPTSAWARARRAAVELTAESIEQVAERVADLLEQRAEQRRMPSAGLVDVAELALYLGVTRAWVYQHAAELGAIRIGSGPRARMRFDLEVAKEMLAEAGRLRSTAEDPPRPARMRQGSSTRPAPLLPIMPRRVRGALARVRGVRRIRGW